MVQYSVHSTAFGILGILINIDYFKSLGISQVMSICSPVILSSSSHRALFSFRCFIALIISSINIFGPSGFLHSSGSDLVLSLYSVFYVFSPPLSCFISFREEISILVFDAPTICFYITFSIC